MVAEFANNSDKKTTLRKYERRAIRAVGRVREPAGAYRKGPGAKDGTRDSESASSLRSVKYNVRRRCVVQRSRVLYIIQSVRIKKKKRQIFRFYAKIANVKYPKKDTKSNNKETITKYPPIVPPDRLLLVTFFAGVIPFIDSATRSIGSAIVFGCF